MKREGEPAPKSGRVIPREVIGPPRCPIMIRWTLASVRGRKLMLHHFLPNADDRDDHDHPASFWTFVLRGGYDDYVPCPWCGGEGAHSAPGAMCVRNAYGWTYACPRCENTGTVAGERMRLGMLSHRAATYRHRTRVLPSGCWTLVWMGPKERPWGFWRNGRWWPWKLYERHFGFGMRCPE